VNLASLLQSSVSHDPSQITLMWWSRNIYDYYQCWKLLCWICIFCGNQHIFL